MSLGESNPRAKSRVAPLDKLCELTYIRLLAERTNMTFKPETAVVLELILVDAFSG
jgi:hypothetical protein